LDHAGLLKKALAPIVLLALVAIGLLGFATYQVLKTDQRYSVLVDQEQKATFKLIRGNRHVTGISLAGYQVLTYGATSSRGIDAIRSIEKSRTLALASSEEAASINPKLAGTLGRFEDGVDRVHRATMDAVRVAEQGDANQARLLMGRANDALDQFTKELVVLNNSRIEAGIATSHEISEASNRTLIWSLVLGTLMSLVAAAFGLYVIKGGVATPLLSIEDRLRRIAGGDGSVDVPGTDRKDEIGSIARAVEVLRDGIAERVRLAKDKERAEAEQNHVVATMGSHLDRLAAGDLTASIQEDFSPAYVKLRDSFNSALTSLGGLIQSVSESASEIRTGSGEIAQASEDLARRTESNAASLEETSAAVAQMSERLKATATSSTETVGRADQAIATVTGGRAVADEAVQAMGRVSDSAKGIDSVIEGLDKIAFQTRVLAMNAAVEAGRAGEAGRGFAVLADLVSALAMRAEEEAKRARDQLTVTQTDIVTAVGAVEKVDSALAAISSDVSEVHQLLGSMARDNQAQALAVTEINAAISSMDQSTQQNAAMVEETSAAARNLLSEVNGLAEQAGRFRTSGGVAAQRVVATLAPALPAAKSAAPGLPKRGKEGSYASPVKALPPAGIEALVRSAAVDDDWKEF
jgi:methyl-accepting chemotaxis protein